MKLYELKKNSHFTVDKDDSGTVFRLDHIDGMYSVCYYTDAVNATTLVHIAAFAEVTEVILH